MKGTILWVDACFVRLVDNSVAILCSDPFPFGFWLFSTRRPPPPSANTRVEAKLTYGPQAYSHAAAASDENSRACQHEYGR